METPTGLDVKVQQYYVEGGLPQLRRALEGQTVIELRQIGCDCTDEFRVTSIDDYGMYAIVGCVMLVVGIGPEPMGGKYHPDVETLCLI